MGAARHRARLRDGVPRLHRRQRRPAPDRRGPRRRDLRAAVDDQRLRADPRGADPSRRVARRPLRAATGLPGRRRVVRGRLAGLCARDRRRDAVGGPRVPGGRRRPADPRQPCDPAGLLPARGPGAGDRRLVRAGRHLRRGRPLRRRLAGGARRLALGLPAQPAAGRGRRPGDRAPRAGEPRPDGHPVARPARCGPRRGRSGAADLRADRLAGEGGGRPVGARRSVARDGRARSLRLARARPPGSRCCRSRSSRRGCSAPPTR